MFVTRLKNLRLATFVIPSTGLVALLSLPACNGSDDKDAVARGQEAVMSRNCASCHTPSDKPESTLAGSNNPFCTDGKPCNTGQVYPANLTPDEATGMAGWSDDMIVKAILTGVDDEDAALCPPMPHFGEEGMADSEAHDIVAYLKSLPPVAHSVPESSCPPIKTAAPEGDAGK